MLLLACAVCGCADAQGEGALPEENERRAAALLVEEAAASGPDALFTTITGIDVDSRGRIYVADWDAARVTVLDSAGALVGVIGRPGAGPGEFRSLRGLQILAGDSLLAYDPGAARISVFPPDADRPANMLNLAAGLGGPPPFLVHRSRSNDYYLALFRPPFTPAESEPRRDVLRVLDLEGWPRGEPLRVFPSRAFLRANRGRSFMVMPDPFGSEALYALGTRGEVHLAWSDTLRVETVDTSGRRIGGFAAEYTAPPVSDDDVRAAVAGLPPQMAGVFRPVLHDSLPPRWPAMRALLADDRGRLWVGLNGGGAEGEWLAFDPAGRYLGSAFLPRSVDVLAVRGDRLFGVRVDELGVPAVVAYRIVSRTRNGTD